MCRNKWIEYFDYKVLITIYIYCMQILLIIHYGNYKEQIY